MRRKVHVLIGATALALGELFVQLDGPQGLAEAATRPAITLGLKNERAFFTHLEQNLHSWEFADRQEWIMVLRRYRRSLGEYRHFLVRGLRGNDRERQLNSLTLLGLLRLPEFAGKIIDLARHHAADDTLQAAVAFYLHRIGRAPGQNLERLLGRLPPPDERPSDDWTIFWLGFVDTPEPVRSRLQEIYPRADGAAAELIREALDWLAIRCPADVTPRSCRKDPWL
jgi:hypothetical protein